jgi:hypothetical protein
MAAEDWIPFEDMDPFWHRKHTDRYHKRIREIIGEIPDEHALRDDIDNGPGMWTPKGRDPMKIVDMDTDHLINTVALIWRTTAIKNRELLPRPGYPVIKLKLDDPEEKIREMLKELKKRDALPKFVRVR